MSKRRMPRALWAVLTAALLTAPQAVSAHFIWITVEPAEGNSPAGAKVEAFLGESPVPEGAQFLRFVKDLKLVVDGQPIPSSLGEDALEARWAGKLPTFIDAERDLGVMSRGGKSHHLVYTARAQAGAVSISEKPAGDKLRVRLVEDGGKPLAQVLFDGKPLAGARLKAYPDGGKPAELKADDRGLAEVAGLAGGTTALWANHADGKPGTLDGKPFEETRYYATLTFRPAVKDAPAGPATRASEAREAASESRSAFESASAEVEVPTAFARMPEPAVNSFGGAVLGDWLYVYSGHIGRTHKYSVETTSKLFRRLNLKDRTTWEVLPMPRDVQGVALVSDGKALYRVGGMSARNAAGAPQDMHSVADFARFDPESKTWTDLPPLPQARSTHDAAVVGGTVYVVGGWTMQGASEESEFLEDAVAFDLSRPQAGWKSVEQPFRRRALSAAEAGGKLYVLGGLNDLGKVERRVDVYDPATGAWTTGPELPGSSKVDGFGTSAFGVDGRLYYSGTSGRVFRLDGSGAAWEAVGAWSLPRITHRLLPGPGHTLLAVGGNSRGRQTPVIEAVTVPTAAKD